MANRQVERLGAGRISVAELRPGERIKTILLTLDKQSLVARTGAPYLALILGDRTGVVNARMWDRTPQYEGTFEGGDFLLVDAHVETYRGQTQLRLVHLEKVDPDGVEISDFQPASRFDRAGMLEDLRALVHRAVVNSEIRKVLVALIELPEVTQGLLRSPAAKFNHHAYLGGLLEHTLSMCRLGLEIGRHYQEGYPGVLDSDYLVAGALLHDLGKIWEFSSDRQIDLTDAGRLLGHATMGVEVLTRAMNLAGVENEAIALRLKHMILSHHGELEYGASVLPQTPEAQVLHYIDQIDARMNMFADAIKRTEGNWSEYVKPLGRFVYAVPPTTANAAAEQAVVEPGMGLEDEPALPETRDLFGDRPAS